MKFEKPEFKKSIVIEIDMDGVVHVVPLLLLLLCIYIIFETLDHDKKRRDWRRKQRIRQLNMTDLEKLDNDIYFFYLAEL